MSGILLQFEGRTLTQGKHRGKRNVGSRKGNHGKVVFPLKDYPSFGRPDGGDSSDRSRQDTATIRDMPEPFVVNDLERRILSANAAFLDSAQLGTEGRGVSALAQWTRYTPGLKSLPHKGEGSVFPGPVTP
jgi:hypothetical protein